MCIKYGVPVAIGDTMGPAALARNLRAVPVVIDIIRDVQALAPKALMLNFTNPMSCITGAMARNSSIPCYGLCHSADSMFQYVSEIFSVRKKDVQLEIGGVNHQAFVTRAIIKGKDRTKEILAASKASAAQFHDALLTTSAEEVTLQQDVCEILGAWPSTGDTHLAEFYKYFMTPRRVGQLQHGLLGTILPGRPAFGRKDCPPIIHEWAYGSEPVGDLHLLTSEHAHEVMWAYLTGEPYTRILNLVNTGEYLKGIPKTACVEAMVTVAGRKVTGKQITLPPAVQSLVYNWTAIHELSIQAAVNCDRDAARQALFLDPHVGDMYDIKPMLEDMLQALRPWLSGKWFKE